MLLPLSLLAIIAAVNSLEVNLNLKSWCYTPISVEAKTSNEALIKLDLRVERISRTEFTISGTADFNYDVTDNHFVEMFIYRSATGSSDYSLLPFSMKKRTFNAAVDTFYKDFVMASMAECSNLPQFTGKFKPPWEKKIYELNQCFISNANMPVHMQDGFYKIVIAFTGEPEWSFELLVKVEQNFV